MEILRADKVLVGIAVIGILGVIFDSIFGSSRKRSAGGGVTARRKADLDQRPCQTFTTEAGEP
jgi:hypothetical protein